MKAGVNKYQKPVVYLMYVALIIPNSSGRLSGNERDQLGLQALKAKITHDPQGVFRSWNISLHLCSWEGIKCGKRHKRVTSINLSSKGLEGSLSPYIGNMSFLREIILYNNHFQGAIPREVDRLFRLKVLSLGQNALVGNIPDTLGRLDRLVILELFSNKLSGMIPASVFNLSLLNVLNLANNQLQGSIPPDFGLIHPDLQKAKLSNNNLSGTIPRSLSNASKLHVIDLQFNSFSGPVFVDFGRLPYLQKLGLGNNNLGFGEHGDLNFLDSLINCSSLKILELGANNLQGSLPRSIVNLSTDLTMLSLADNRIYGSIPVEISKFINLIFLSLEDNKFTGIIPSEIAKLGNLQRVVLSNNKVSGNIPASIGNLSRLDEIHLENNEFYGTIPPSFGNCPMLVLLDLSQNNLSGTITNELFNISPFSVKLNLSRNHLVGSLPAGIGALKTLVELDISENEFSGLIPTELGDCIVLNTLYMQSNFFQGNISQSMQKLRGLQNVDLSRNKLSGKIPDFFETMSLKYLNLSWNNLEGEVHGRGLFTNASAFSIAGNKGLCGGILELQLPRCSTEGSHKWVPILLVIGFIEFLLSIGCYKWVRSRKGKSLSYSKSEIDTSPIKLSYRLLQQATDGFSQNNLVSEGFSGSVYKGKLGEQSNEKEIAIKVFNAQASNRFLNECKALRNIRHINIIKIKSTCSSFTEDKKKFTAIVYDYMEHGSLDRWQHSLIKESDVELGMPQILNLRTRINIATDVATALDYLHNQSDNPLIHCNLKPSSILLDTQMSAHVSNFGLAKFLTELGSTVQGSLFFLNSSPGSFNGFAGTFGYAPPEYFQGSMVSTKGDVYSYGIILLEMITGKKINDPMFHGSFKLQNFVSNAITDRVYDIIDPFILNELGTEAADARGFLVMLLNIGMKCAQKLPRLRPDIRDILGAVQTVRDDLKYRRWRIEVPKVPSQSLQERDLGRGKWTVDTARQFFDPFPQIASKPVTLSYMDLHKATDGFSPANLIGAGGFGSVYKGTFDQEYVRLLRHSGIEDEIVTAVAIKVYNLQRRGAVRSFNTEYQTLENIDHASLVKIITTCTSLDQDGRDFRAILFELMDHGSLEMWLHPTKKRNHDGPLKPRILTLYARISIAIDIAYALDYLHSQCKNGIIHCDLKPGNILIDKNMFAHIADFGLARSLSESQNMNNAGCSSSSGIRGTTGYIAPEYGLGCNMTAKGDTYSFGIVLLEMLTGKKPTDGMFRGGLTLHTFVSLGLFEDVINITDPLMMVMTSGDGKRVKDCLTKMYHVGLACSKTSPKNRPEMRTVARKLESIRNGR